MTCIVGLIDQSANAGGHTGGAVWLGGDSAVTTGGWDLRLTRTPKVFRRDVPTGQLVGPRTRPMLLGSTGPSRLRQLLSLALEIPEHPATMAVETYLAMPFMDAVRACLKAAGYARRESDQEQHDGMFLVGYAGHLFTVTGDYLAFEGSRDYEAIGSGGELACGALAAMERMERMERMEAIEDADVRVRLAPAFRVHVALEAAARHNAGCAPPFHILCTAGPHGGMGAQEYTTVAVAAADAADDEDTSSSSSSKERATA